MSTPKGQINKKYLNRVIFVVALLYASAFSYKVYAETISVDDLLNIYKSYTTPKIATKTPVVASPAVKTSAPISNQALVTALRTLIRSGLPEDIKKEFQGPVGPAGATGPQGPSGTTGYNFSFTPPTANPNTGPIGLIGGFANLGVQNFESTNILVTNNITQTGSGTTSLRNVTVTGGLNVTSGSLNPGLTAGSIFFQGASGISENNSNFFWDNTNGRLGIGTNNPSAKLYIRDATNARIVLDSPNTASINLGASGALSSVITLAGSEDANIQFTNDDLSTDWTIGVNDTTGNTFKIYDNNTTTARLSIDGSGLMTLNGPVQVTSTNTFTTGTGLATFGGNVTVAGATGVTLSGNDADIVFSGTGNHDIIATSGTLRIGSNVIIGNIEAVDNSIDIGTPGVRFDKIYANEVNASSIVGTITGGNVSAETLNLNSDNATNDAEDSFLSFERGTAIPNALLGWDSANNEFDLNSGLVITNTIGAANGLVVASGNVGIGTSTPTKMLTLYGGSQNIIATSDARLTLTDDGSVNSISGIQASPSGGGFHLASAKGTSKHVSTAADGDTYLSTRNAGNNLLFAINNSEKVRIDTNGNVGIGNTSPGSLLTIGSNSEYTFGTSAGQKISINGSGINVSQAVAEQLTLKGYAVGNAVYQAWRNSTDTRRGYFGYGSTSSSNFTLMNEENGTLSFGTNNATAITVLGTGNVGIGVTSSTARLTVRGSGLISQDLLHIEDSGGVRMLEAVSDASGNAQLQIKDTLGATKITLNSAGDSSFMGGNVGIGTTSPTYKLDVTGTARFSSTTRTGLLEIDSNTTDWPTVDSTRVSIFETGGGVSYPFSEFGNLVLASRDTGATRDIVFATGNPSVVRMVVGRSGNVGISTTSAGALMDIYGTSATTDFRVTRASSPSNYFSIAAPGGTNTQATLGVAGTSGLSIRSNGGIGIGAYAGTDTAIPANGAIISGNVGIGTATPQKGPSPKLEVNGGRAYIVPTAEQYALGLSRTDFGGTFYLGVAGGASTPDLVFSNNGGSELVRITTGGNFGVGENNPAYKMQVTAGATDGLSVSNSAGVISARFINSSANPVITRYTNNSGNFFDIQNNTDNSFSIDYNDSEKFRITSSGNVGIGTTNPGGNKLDVQGLVSVGAPASTQQTLTIQGTNSGTDITSTSHEAATLYLTNLNGTANTYADIRFSDAGGNSTSGIAGIFVNDATNQGDLAFTTRPSGGNLTERMRILGNGNVGIGTTNPTFTLDIQNAAASQQIKSTNTNYAYTEYANTSSLLRVGVENNSGGGLLTGTSANAGVIGQTGAFPLQFSTTNVVRMTILSGGNIGIGSTNPLSKLDIGGSGATLAGVSAIQFGDTNSASSRNFAWSNGAGGNTTDLIGKLVLSAGTAQGTNALAGTALMTITSSGNVGIGTTAPGTSLVVVNNNYTDTYSSTLTFEAARFHEHNTQNNVETGGHIALTLSNNSTISEFEVGRIAWKQNQGTSGGSLRFHTTTTAGTLTERLRIDSSGNVGIGTTNPSQKLNVDTGVSTTGQGIPASSGTTQNGILRLRPGAATYGETLDFGMNVSSSYGWIQATNATNLATNYSLALNPNGGNVGIGTTNPLTSLQIRGTDAVFNPASVGNGFYGGPFIQTSTGVNDNATALTFGYNSSGGVGAQPAAGIYVQSSGSYGSRMFFGTTGSFGTINTRLSIIENGNVGIGTTSPTSTLQVVGTANISSASTFGSTVTFGASTNGGVIDWDTSNWFITAKSGKGLYLGANATAGQVVVNTTGNVGIGTTNPLTRLDVRGTAAAIGDVGMVNIQDSSFNGLTIGYDTTSNSAWLYGRSLGVTTRLININNSIYANYNGSVGIGTSGPNFTGGTGLEIERAGVATLRLDNTSASKAFEIQASADGVDFTGMNGGQPFRFNVGGVERARIDTVGNVAIGTTSALSKLTINSNAAWNSSEPFVSFVNLDPQGADSNGLFVQAGASTSGAYIANFADYNGASKLYVRGDGNVGIGTTVPGTKLDVRGNNGAFQVKATTDTSSAYLLTLNGTAQTYLGTESSVAGATFTGTTAYSSFVMASSGQALHLGSNAAHITILSGGNVGIGTTNPGKPLDVVGDVRSTSGSGQFLLGYPGGAAKIRLWDSVGTETVNLSSNGATYFNGGNVGIGTTGPNATLDVRNATGATVAIFNNSSGTVDANSGIRINAPISTAKFNWMIAAQQNVNNGFEITPSTAAGGSTFSTPAFVVLSSGNVGVGTSNPGTVFEAQGANKGITQGTIEAWSTDSFAIDKGGSLGFRGKYTSGGGTHIFGSIQGAKETATDGDEAGYLRFSTPADNANPTEKLRITSSGNIGIGTTIPGAKLDLRNGDFHLTDTDIAHSMTTVAPTATYSVMTAASGTEGGLQMYGLSDAAGTLGVNITGIIGSNDPTDTVAAVGLQGGKYNGGSSWQALGSLETVFQLKNFSTNLMTVLGSGNVGLGNIDPLSLLTLQTASDDPTNGVLLMSSGNNPTDYVGLSYTMNANNDVDLQFGRKQSNEASFTKFMTLKTSTGNLGIGTTSPTAPLSVKTDSSNNTIRLIGRATDSYSSFFFRNSADSANQAFIQSGNTNMLEFGAGTTGSPKMVLDSNGNVGIGTTAANFTAFSNTALTIQNNSTTGRNAGLELYGNRNGAGESVGRLTFINEQSTTASKTIAEIVGMTDPSSYDAESGGLQIQTSDTSGTRRAALTINSSQNVGIGTTAPGTRFVVDKSQDTNNTEIAHFLDSGLATNGNKTYILVGKGTGSGNSTELGYRYDSTPANTYGWVGLYGDQPEDGLAFKKGGSVGIGTNNPGRKLSVQAGDGDGIRIQHSLGDTSGQYVSLDFSPNSAYGSYFSRISSARGSGTEADLRFATSASGGPGLIEKMRLSAAGGLSLGNSYVATDAGVGNMIISGNVGIGTTTPNGPLQVSGGDGKRILFSEGAVTDYGEIGYGFNVGNKGSLWIGVNLNSSSLTVAQSDTANASWYSRFNAFTDQYTINRIAPAGADTALLTITSAGNVGIGTSSPGVATSAGRGYLTLSGSTSMGVLEMITQTADADGNPLGALQFTDKNSTNPSKIAGFINVALQGATANNRGSYMSFFTKANNGDLAEGMRIDNTGSMRIGVTTILTYASQMSVQYTGASTEYGLVMRPLNNTTTAVIFQNAAGTDVGSITQDASSVAYNNLSDGRYKENIVNTQRGLETLMNIQVRDYNFIADPTKTRQGYIAQELYEVYPDAVTVGSETKPWAVDYSKLTPLLVKSTQEVNLKITGVEERLAALEAASGGSNESWSSLASQFFTEGIKSMSDGVIYMRTLVVDTLKVGSPEKRTGITLYDEVTGDPYCVSVANGAQKTAPGECQIFEPTPSSGGSGEGASEPSEGGSPEGITDTTPPVISLNGDATINLVVGDTYSEQGATANDDMDGGIMVIVTGAVDTAVAGTYTIHYQASDSSGNMAEEVLRTINVTE